MTDDSVARSEGLEPPTDRFEAWRSIQLSYDRTHAYRSGVKTAVGGTRTPNLQVRSLLLYPIELRPRVPKRQNVFSYNTAHR